MHYRDSVSYKKFKFNPTKGVITAIGVITRKLLECSNVGFGERGSNAD